MRTWMAALCSAVLAMGLVTAATTSAEAATPSSGWNDWSCRPSAAHPEPVVLAHGLGANGTDNFLIIAPYLVHEGYCVYSTTYGAGVLGSAIGGLGPMEDSAATFSTFVDRVRSATHSAKVDVVGHSEGTTVPAYYMKFLGGAAKVDRFVGFGSNFAGTSMNGLSVVAMALHFQSVLNGVGCVACSEYLPGSAFLERLDAGGVAVPGPVYTSIMSTHDTVVTPYTSGTLTGPNVTNVVLQRSCNLDFSGHVGLAADPNILSRIRYYLDPAHAPKPGCVLYWPLGA